MEKFWQFYNSTFLPEHSNVANRLLHYLGVYLGLAAVTASVIYLNGWLLLAFLPAHVLPGLIGHYLFERSESVGNLRVNRKDFPIYWFLVANHFMAFTFPFRQNRK
jgi:hypothetical protein